MFDTFVDQLEAALKQRAQAAVAQRPPSREYFAIKFFEQETLRAIRKFRLDFYGADQKQAGAVRADAGPDSNVRAGASPRGSDAAAAVQSAGVPALAAGNGGATKCL